MEILITDMIRCVSGKFNSFSFTEERDNLGRFLGVDVHVALFAEQEDLQRANLIHVLEIQFQTHLKQMQTLDKLDEVLPYSAPQNLREYTVKAVRNSQEYIYALKNNAKITYFLE